MNVLDRILKHTMLSPVLRSPHVDTPCREWVGQESSRYPGVRDRNQRWTYAHRVVWEENAGPIPKGIDVCHRCDNMKCCEFEHLFLGTRAVNLADAVAKGRTSRTKNFKISNEIATTIRELCATGTPQRAVAQQFGVSQATVSLTVRQLRWKG